VRLTVCERVEASRRACLRVSDTPQQTVTSHLSAPTDCTDTWLTRRLHSYTTHSVTGSVIVIDTMLLMKATTSALGHLNVILDPLEVLKK